MRQREIKFRGISTQSNGWLYGLYAQDAFGGDFIRKDKSNKNGACPIFVKTLGQFTGFKDHQQKEVYEGDIYRECLETDHGDQYAYSVCIWLPEYASFCLLGAGEYLEYESTGVSSFEPANRYSYLLDEVEFGLLTRVGNIYENPQLLELSDTPV